MRRSGALTEMPNEALVSVELSVVVMWTMASEEV